MRRAVPIFACAFLTIACGPTALREQDTTPTVSLGGDRSGRVETLTDLEEVRDVASSHGSVFVATDMGLLRYASNGEAEVLRVEGLPSGDVRALVDDDGALLAATAGGLIRIADDAATPVEGVPDVGGVTDLARTADGTVWMCGLGGVARRTADGWEAFGEPVPCTTLAPTPEGQVWIGTSAGVLYVEGDVVREHPISGGIPDASVRSVVPVLPGKIMALVQGPTDSKIAYWDGEKWYAYTLRGMNEPAIGLVRRGADVLLVSPQRVVAIGPSGRGVPLVALSSTEGTVRSFRARITPAAQHQPGEQPGRDAIAPPRALAVVPEGQPTIAAPAFTARALELDLPGRAYAAFADGADGYLAIANGGVERLRASGAPRTLRSRSLVPEELQIATDPAHTVWVLARDRALTKLVDGRLRRVSLPEGLSAQAIATGPEGAYMVALDPSAGPSAIRVFRNAGEGWSPIAQRSLTLPTALSGVPFIGVSPDRVIWAALRIQREDGSGDRLRGFAVIDPNGEEVVYHHRAADRDHGGLPVPDEVSAIDFDTDGNAWVASLSGLVRVGSAQAVVFGESRGVRGEVVSDTVVGDSVVWVASAEGLGAYDRTRFDYAQPSSVQQARPTQLAMDSSGNLWASSAHGLVVRRGDEWSVLGEDAGLPVVDLRDVQTDGAGRVWLLAEDRVIVLSTR